MPAGSRIAGAVDSKQNAQGMNRLYAVESTPTLTGAVADHRWPLNPLEIESFTRMLAERLGVDGIEGPENVPGFSEADWNVLLSDLNNSSLRRLVVVGQYQPPWVQATRACHQRPLASDGPNGHLYGRAFRKPIAQ